MSDTALKSGDTSTVTLVFSEAVLGFANNDVTVVNGTLATMTSSDNITWTGTYTPTADVEDATNVLTLATSYTDTAGNAGPSATTANFTIDTKAPTVSSFTMSDTALKSGDTSTVTIVFSEAVAGFASDDDVAVVNGALASMTSSDNITWTGTYTPTADVEDATNVLTLGTAWTDTAGNAYGGSSTATANFTIDTTSPTVSSFTMSDTALKSGDTSTVTIVFSEAVAGFASDDDVAVVNGALASMTSSDNITWTGVYTPTADVEDATNVLTLGTTWTDTAGNAYGGSSTDTANFTIDTTAPTVSSFTMSDTALKSGDTSTVTIVFSEAVAGFANSDVTVVNGALTTMTSSDNITWTGAYTPTADVEDATNVLTLATSYTDTAGNAGPSATTANFTIDTNTPTVSSFTMSDTALKSGDTSTVTIVFSESVAGFSNSDVTVVNGALTTMTSSDNITWAGTYTPTADVEDATNVLTLGTAWTDTAGNAYGGNVTTTANFTIDTTAPTVTSFTMSDTDLKSGDTSTVTLVFSESVAAFASDDDVAVVNGALASMSSSDNITWTGTYTPTADVEDATNVLTLATSWTDTAGNAYGGNVTTTANFTIDTTSPTVTSFTMSDTDLKSGDTSTVTIIFSEAVAGFANSDVTVVNGALTSMTSSNNITWTGTYTPTADVEDATNVLILATSYTDTAGNAGPSATTANFTIDTTAPTVSSFTMSDTDLKSGDTSTVTLVFSEAVAGFASVSDVTVVNGALTTMTSSDNITWTGTYTPTADVEDATNVLTLATSYTDTAGNTGPSATTANFTIDTTSPTVSSFTMSDTDLKSGDTSTVTIVFSEAVAGFANSDVTVVNGALATMTSSDNITWTGVYTPTADVEDATNVLTLGTTWTDTAGNVYGGSSTDTANFTIDTTSPTVSSFTMSDTALKSGDTSTVTIVFSESVAGFSNSDVTVVNGALATMTSSDNITWTGTYTPTADVEDATNVLTLGTTWTDTAGNAYGGSSTDTANFTIDTTAPAVSSFTMSDTDLKSGDTSTVTIVFSEAVAGFASNDDVTAPNGALASMTSSDNITWTGVYTPTANVEDATNVLTLATSYTDTAGNTGPSATTANFTIDTTAPTVSSFTMSDTALKSGDTSTVTIVFSEAVAGFANSDVTVVNGALTTMTSSDNITWTGTYTPTADVEDATNVLTLATSYTDTAGNAGPSATTANFTIDTTSPTVTSFTMSDTALQSGDTSTVTIVFSESVAAFASDDDVAVVNGVLASMTSSDNITWTGVYTPTTNVEDATNVLTLATSWTDTAGNLYGGSVTTTANFTIDTTSPTVTSFTMSDTDLKSGDTSTVTIVFSEVVVGFASDDDVTAPNGVLTSMTSSNNITWTGVYTPTANVEDATNVLTLATSYTDTAGNAGPSATTANFTIDTTAPTVSSFTMSDTALQSGDTSTVTIVFSEAVAGFASVSDVTVVNGALTTMTSSDNITWTGTYTPTADVEDATNVLTLATNYTDIAGNAGPSATTANFTIDTKSPTVSSFTMSDTALKSGDTSTVTVVFSESVAGFANNDVTVVNGALASMTSSDNITWTGTYTPTADVEDATNVLTLGTAWTDTAGNAYGGGSTDTANFTIDTTVPTINAIETTAFSWGSVLNSTEDDSEGVVTVTTAGVEDGQVVSIVLNGVTDTGIVSGNSATITIAASDLQALTDGQSYTLTADVNDAAGNSAAQVTSSSFIVDVTAPVITITGANPATVELGATYTDASASADGGETVTSISTVDTSTVGTYTVTYTSTDAAGNTATATRTVNVVDTTAPVITVTGANPATVELGATYTDAGATATDLSGNVTVTSTSTVDTSTVGTYTVTYTSTDAAG